MQAYPDDVAVSHEEDSLGVLDAGADTHFLQVFAEMLKVITSCQGQAEEVTVGDVGGELDDGLLAGAVHAYEQHVAAGLAEDASRAHDVLQCVSEKHQLRRLRQNTTVIISALDREKLTGRAWPVIMGLGSGQKRAGSQISISCIFILEFNS